MDERSEEEGRSGEVGALKLENQTQAATDGEEESERPYRYKQTSKFPG